MEYSLEAVIECWVGKEERPGVWEGGSDGCLVLDKLCLGLDAWAYN